MGLAISIFLALPIGLGVGCCLGPCVTKAFQTSTLERKFCSARNLLFPSLLVFGVIGLYVPLLILCANYDGVSVATAMTTGSCWSTGGNMPYNGLGVAAGIVTGIGVTGCLWLMIALLRSRAADKDKVLLAVDVEQGQDPEPEPTATDGGEQTSAADNATITVS